VNNITTLINAYLRITKGGWETSLKSQIIKAAWGRPAWIAYQSACAQAELDDVYGQFDDEIRQILLKN
jgi:hypothetical protein